MLYQSSHVLIWIMFFFILCKGFSHVRSNAWLHFTKHPRMLQNEGFCQKKERLLPNLKTFKSRSSLWLDQCLGRGLCSLCTVLLSYFCKLIHFCVQRYSPKPAQDFYTALCFMCWFLVCWSVFRPIEANTCLLLYNWAVNVNRVITNLAQSVFLFSFFFLQSG